MRVAGDGATESRGAGVPESGFLESGTGVSSRRRRAHAGTRGSPLADARGDDKPSGPSVLLVEDDAPTRVLIARVLGAKGYRVREAGTLAEADAVLKDVLPDVAVLDFSLPDGDAFDLLRRLRQDDAQVPVVMLTAHASVELAVRAVKEGAEQFLVKPPDVQALALLLERVLDHQRSRQVAAVRQARQGHPIDPFAGESPSVRKLAAQARRLAGASLPVLIQGETGTGKGVLAHWLHQNGRRADEAFVDLNCAGLAPELLESELFGHERGAFTGAVAAKSGLFELAHRGTLFLDEMGDMDLRVQPKLLKVIEEQRFRRLGGIQERQVDVRLISATHRDLAALVRDGRFREDLLYRAGAVTLVVPALRERGRDVVALARSILERLGPSFGRPGVRLSGAAEDALVRHAWPGNLRELRNVLERALLFGEGATVDAHELPVAAEPQAASPPAGDVTLAAAERRHIESVLHAEGRSVEQAARVLGLSRSALYDRIRKHGIRLPHR